MEAEVLKGLTVGTQISGRHEGTQDVGLPGGDGYFSSILAIMKNRPTVGPYANDNPEYINHTNDFPITRLSLVAILPAIKTINTLLEM
jgi:hypothetical protein